MRHADLLEFLDSSVPGARYTTNKIKGVAAW